MNSNQKCHNNFCQAVFEITEQDKAFYQKMGVPEPKICFDCRQRQKLAFRNERVLYNSTCKLCGKNMVSIYSKDKSYPVYCTSCWWGDNWDPMSYGRDFDFSRPFFPQVKELFDAVPKLGILSLGEMVNSDYSHDAIRLVNCYLIFDGEQAKDCFYGETFVQLADCADFLFVQKCELCYECTNCNNCYNVNYSRYSNNCSDSNFLLNCQNCRNCFGCANLQNKQYCIFNKQYSKEEYENIIKMYDLGDYKTIQKLKKECEAFYLTVPQKYMHGTMNENVTGENLHGCKDTFESYDSAGLRDCKYCTNMVMGATDCYDVNIWGNNVSLAYNTAGVGEGGQNVIACYYIAFGARNIFHSIFCLQDIENLLGCVGVRHKKNCILNKQYSEEEFKLLSAKIIDHMKKTGEWGEFFPPSLSAFGYNETVANEYYPLNREQATIHGFNWHTPDPKEYQKQSYLVPENIKNVTDQITKEVLACETCGKNFKIVIQELSFYRKKIIPIPTKCPDCRHKDRLNLRNPRKLWERSCSKCKMKIKSSYSPERSEIVYCENCYLKEVY